MLVSIKLGKILGLGPYAIAFITCVLFILIGFVYCVELLSGKSPFVV